MLLTSCASIREADPSTASVRGVAPTVEQLNITSSTQTQNALVADLTAKAGLPPLPGRHPDWSVVAEAGFYEIGRQCDQYLDVQFQFNRRQRAARQELTATGAATATILGLSGVAAAPIAITAAAFGLSASLFDANVNSVLFTIEPSAVRNIVLKGRKGYIDDLKMEEINTRPRMMMALQGYLSQCSPAAIEANVNNAASGAESVASTDPAVARRAAVLAAPSSILFQRAARTTEGTVTNAPRPLTEAERPRGPIIRGEENVLRPDVTRVQAALGTAADGEFGDKTRAAIGEFERGLNRRAPATWKAKDGSGSIVALPPKLSPLPAVFKSPFERAYFGSVDANLALEDQYVRLDPTMLNGFLLRLGPPRGEQFPTGNTDADLAVKLEMMRKKLGELNGTNKPTALTSAGYDLVPTAAGGPSQ
jgi:hypothetical protein